MTSEYYSRSVITIANSLTIFALFQSYTPALATFSSSLLFTRALQIFGEISSNPKPIQFFMPRIQYLKVQRV